MIKYIIKGYAYMRALISVSDKSGVENLREELGGGGFEGSVTGGTYNKL